MIRCFALCALCFPGVASAQPHIAARVHLGVEEHGEVGGLNTWQDEEWARFDARGIPVEITSEFPSHVAAEVAVGAGWGVVEAGILMGYGSTGGQIAYADYSGSLVIDRLVERRTLGSYIEALPLRIGRIHAGLGLTARTNETAVRYGRRLRLGDEVLDEVEAELAGTSWSLEPALLADIEVAGPLRARLRLGWESSRTGRLGELDDLEEIGALPVEADSSGLGVSWDGLRASVGLSVRVSL